LKVKKIFDPSSVCIIYTFSAHIAASNTVTGYVTYITSCKEN